MVKTQDKNFRQTDPLLILPAAGFGTRSGLDFSKELKELGQGETLISFHLRQALERKWPVHVITRQEKQDLITYLQKFSDKYHLEIFIQVIEPSREWPDTILQSSPYWRENNILCLPDTIFEPVTIIDELLKKLNQEAELAVAGFMPSSEISSWGYVSLDRSGEIDLCEKPNGLDFKQRNLKAWGLLGFQKNIGQDLFSAQLQSTFDHQWKTIKGHGCFLDLKLFADRTR